MAWKYDLKGFPVRYTIYACPFPGPCHENFRLKREDFRTARLPALRGGKNRGGRTEDQAFPFRPVQKSLITPGKKGSMPPGIRSGKRAGREKGSGGGWIPCSAFFDARRNMHGTLAGQAAIAEMNVRIRLQAAALFHSPGRIRTKNIPPLPHRKTAVKERKDSMKKRIALLLVLCLVAGIVPAFALESDADALPSRFDLRSYGVVTPVKRQNPWNSCWSFGGIAAAETSILTSLGMTCEEYREMTGTDFDLSEKHLIWFASRPITALTEESQAGEGLYFVDQEEDPMVAFEGGGKGVMVTTLFAAGVGPVFEEAFPYRGAEGLTDAAFMEKYPDRFREEAVRSVEQELGLPGMHMTLKDLSDRREEYPELLQTLVDILKNKGVLDESMTSDGISWETLEEAACQLVSESVSRNAGKGINDYTRGDDWTIPDTTADGRSNRDVYSGFTLVDGNSLPSLTLMENDQWVGINDAGMYAVKTELLKGRGVSILFLADQSMPGEPLKEDGYMNVDTWAQFTYNQIPFNHSVCIVGWDDHYSRENFLKDHQPEGDGAWIVKNSWGSETDYVTLADGTTIQKNNWGIPDSEGRGTGYFYLSYYDRNITTPESMTFDIDLFQAGGDMSVFAYDYMPALFTAGNVNMKVQDVNVVRTANVFTNTLDREVAICGVSTRTAEARARVEYDFYRLKEDAQNPEDGEFLGKKLAYYDYSGFHRESLRGDLTVRPGERIAVVVTETITDRDGVRLYEYAANQSFGKELAKLIGSPMYGIAVVNHGESFVYENGQWTDWADCEPALNEDLAALLAGMGQELTSEMISTDNFSIKLYVVAGAEGQ